MAYAGISQREAVHQRKPKNFLPHVKHDKRTTKQPAAGAELWNLHTIYYESARRFRGVCQKFQGGMLETNRGYVKSSEGYVKGPRGYVRNQGGYVKSSEAYVKLKILTSFHLLYEQIFKWVCVCSQNWRGVCWSGPWLR